MNLVRFALFVLLPSVLMVCSALAVGWYVVRAWGVWRDTGELGTGYWLVPRLGWDYRWPASDRDEPLGEAIIRNRWVLLAWLSVCVVVAFLLTAVGVAWLIAGSGWRSGSASAT